MKFRRGSIDKKNAIAVCKLKNSRKFADLKIIKFKTKRLLRIYTFSFNRKAAKGVTAKSKIQVP